MSGPALAAGGIGKIGLTEAGSVASFAGPALGAGQLVNLPTNVWASRRS